MILSIIKVQCKGLKKENKGAWNLGSFWSFGGAIYLGYGLKSGGRLGAIGFFPIRKLIMCVCTQIIMPQSALVGAFILDLDW